MKVEDLDVLRPEKRIIRLGGKDIDVSFIPCGITFEVDSHIRELRDLDHSKLLDNGEETRKAFEISVKICAAFCSHKYPELDIDWFNSNVDANQVRIFANAIQEALMKAYAGVSVDPKNEMAPRKKKTR